jgi:hypothetical protein
MMLFDRFTTNIFEMIGGRIRGRKSREWDTPRRNSIKTQIGPPDLFEMEQVQRSWSVPFRETYAMGHFSDRGFDRQLRPNRSGNRAGASFSEPTRISQALDE